jgi:hypothetical protein
VGDRVQIHRGSPIDVSDGCLRGACLQPHAGRSQFKQDCSRICQLALPMSRNDETQGADYSNPKGQAAFPTVQVVDDDVRAGHLNGHRDNRRLSSPEIPGGDRFWNGR